MANKKEYAAKNLAWLEEKSKEEGVKPLAKGIYYKVIKSAEKSDKHPTPRNIITAHYSGYTINGKKFDSSRGGAPLAMRLRLDRRLDYCSWTHVGWRPMGDLFACKLWLWTFLSAWYSCPFYPYFRH